MVETRPAKHQHNQPQKCPHAISAEL